MIIWVASYPKSGNTYLRSFLASYYFSEDGKFDFDQLLKIHQFPNMKFSKLKSTNKEQASKNWIFNQNSFFKNLDFITAFWSGQRGSNPRPSRWQRDALPLSYARKFHKI